jgi:hypothetical protein
MQDPPPHHLGVLIRDTPRGAATGAGGRRPRHSQVVTHISHAPPRLRNATHGSRPPQGSMELPRQLLGARLQTLPAGTASQQPAVTHVTAAAAACVHQLVAAVCVGGGGGGGCAALPCPALPRLATAGLSWLTQRSPPAGAPQPAAGTPPAIPAITRHPGAGAGAAACTLCCTPPAGQAPAGASPVAEACQARRGSAGVHGTGVLHPGSPHIWHRGHCTLGRACRGGGSPRCRAGLQKTGRLGATCRGSCGDAIACWGWQLRGSCSAVQPAQGVLLSRRLPPPPHLVGS